MNREIVQKSRHIACANHCLENFSLQEKKIVELNVHSSLLICSHYMGNMRTGRAREKDIEASSGIWTVVNTSFMTDFHWIGCDFINAA